MAQNAPQPAPQQPATQPVRESIDGLQPGPPGWLRIALTIGLLLYLSVVVVGPLSNPVGSEHLTIPVAKLLRPVHQALFLGHGYRFFGPDPGPSHILEYRITYKHDPENQLIGRFPDRDQHWPRLLYHRWFMLSETVYRECSSLPEPGDHRQWLASITQEIEVCRQQGELPSMRQLIDQRDSRQTQYQLATRRRNELVKAVAGHLLRRHSGDRIELYLVQRLIPRPVDVQSGVRLTDSRFLSEPRLIGNFSTDDFQLPQGSQPEGSESGD